MELHYVDCVVIERRRVRGWQIQAQVRTTCLNAGCNERPGVAPVVFDEVALLTNEDADEFREIPDPVRTQGKANMNINNLMHGTCTGCGRTYPHTEVLAAQALPDAWAHANWRAPVQLRVVA